MKIRPVGAGLLYTDGRTDRQTDMTKLIAAFRNFTNAPKKCDWSESCNENHQNFGLVIKYSLDRIQ